MTGKSPRVLAVASGGGHWVQLSRLVPAWDGCAVTYERQAGIEIVAVAGGHDEVFGQIIKRAEYILTHFRVAPTLELACRRKYHNRVGNFAFCRRAIDRCGAGFHLWLRLKPCPARMRICFQ